MTQGMQIKALQVQNEPTVQVIYVISRVIEFVNVGNVDGISDRLQQLHKLIQQDRLQSRINFTRTAPTETPPEEVKPTLGSWQEVKYRRAMPVVADSVPMKNRFAALQAEEGSEEVGSEEGSERSCAMAWVLCRPRGTAAGKRRRERRRPAQRTSTQDQEHQSELTEENEEQNTAASGLQQYSRTNAVGDAVREIPYGGRSESSVSGLDQPQLTEAELDDQRRPTVEEHRIRRQQRHEKPRRKRRPATRCSATRGDSANSDNERHLGQLKLQYNQILEHIKTVDTWLEEGQQLLNECAMAGDVQGMREIADSNRLLEDDRQEHRQRLASIQLMERYAHRGQLDDDRKKGGAAATVAAAGTLA